MTKSEKGDNSVKYLQGYFDQLAKPTFRFRYAHMVTEQSEGPMDTAASKGCFSTQNDKVGKGT